MRPSLAGIPLKDWNDFARSLGYFGEHDMLNQLYRRQGLPLRVIAKRLECSRGTVLYHLRKQGLLSRARGGPNHLRKEIQLEGQ